MRPPAARRATWNARRSGVCSKSRPKPPRAGRRLVAESPYRWVIVALGALMGCVALGAMFSLAVFLAPMSAETGWSRAGISFAMTINFLVMAFGSFGWGAASDRWGARVVTLIGAVLLGVALTLASRSGSLGAFQLTF